MEPLGISVTKADGSKQPFDKSKVVKTCLRMGANQQLANQVAQKVEDRVYEGMPTKKVLQLIFRFMRKDKPGIGHLFDLRRGLSLMGSKPEFEVFVQALLSHHGYEVSSNQILRGHCAEHEVDAIARKDGVTYFVEAKHHLSYHAQTGLDESRIARAVLEDISEGFQTGRTAFRIDRAMIITNTRYSDHAKRYGKCRNIMQVGWNYPNNEGLESMIEEKKLYPISCLRGVRNEERSRLANQGVVFIRQLIEEDTEHLAKKTGLQREAVRVIMEKARQSASTV
ncbi:MAG: restriction endonuclease [Candidatus Bathyarchaeota archaeon]|nr:restriction endonuclease [Candidatus Bathyarchaeota archaeon]